MKQGLIIYLYFLIQLTKQECFRQPNEWKSSLKAYYKNVLQLQQGSLISSRKSNLFFGSGNSGSLFKDNAYIGGMDGVDFTYCYLGQYISISLMQKYLLNTLKIWLYDFNFRYYDIIIYAILNKEKKKICESKKANYILTINFPDQMVEEFQILNVGGNTQNSNLHILKAEAFYKFS